MTMKELGIDRLSVEQRVALAQEIWESLGDARPTHLTDEQQQELRRRGAEMGADPAAGHSWEQDRSKMEPSSVLKTSREWPVSERLELLFRLWDQLVDEGWQPDPTDDLAAELDRRLTAHEADPTNVRSWEQVQERLRKPQ